MENTSTTLEPMLEFLARSLATMEIRTLLQSRTQADRGEKHFIRFTDKVRRVYVVEGWCRLTSARSCSLQEIDELVDEWAPEPLAQPLSTRAEYELGAVPVVAGPNGPKPKLLNGKAVTNLSSLNFTGLAGNEAIKLRAVEILRKYGLGSCGPPGFYGTLGAWNHAVLRLLLMIC